LNSQNPKCIDDISIQTQSHSLLQFSPTLSLFSPFLSFGALFIVRQPFDLGPTSRLSPVRRAAPPVAAMPRARLPYSCAAPRHATPRGPAANRAAEIPRKSCGATRTRHRCRHRASPRSRWITATAPSRVTPSPSQLPLDGRTALTKPPLCHSSHVHASPWPRPSPMMSRRPSLYPVGKMESPSPARAKTRRL
jgi:hypothetical protein